MSNSSEMGVQDPRLDTHIAIPVENLIDIRVGAQSGETQESQSTQRTAEQLIKALRETKELPQEIKGLLTDLPHQSREGVKLGDGMTLLGDGKFFAPTWSNGGFAEAKDTSKKVSVRFEHASAGDVLRWLQKQDVSFIVDESKFDDKARVTLSASNVSLNAITDALASALGGHWELQNGIRVYQKGTGMRAYTALGNMSSTGAFKNFVMPNINPKTFVFPKTGTKLNELEMKGAENARVRAFRDLKGIDGKKFELEMKAAEKMRERAMTEWNSNDGKKWQLQLKEAEKARGQALADVKKHQKDWTSAMQNWKLDWKKLLESITDEQREKQKKQGYLKLSDLTPEQRKLLGSSVSEKGTMQLKIGIDGKELIIKGE